MHGRILVLAAAFGLVAMAAAAPGVAAAQAPSPHYYLALGDSLSQGMQPDLHGVTRDTDQGYTDDLLAIEQRTIPSLQLIKLGCGGDSTTSMLTGHGDAKNARINHCDRAGGSQLAAAEQFLKSHHHKGEVPLVTIDIGANDVDGCVTATNVVTCVTNGLGAIKANLPKILGGLRKAAPAGTKFAGTTLYNPILGGYLAPVGSADHTLMLESMALITLLNQDLTSGDNAAGFLTADVAGAFDTYDSTDTVAWEGQLIPVNVARVCSWTWACQTPPSGPNIHANKNGYAVIAGAFAKVIGRLR